MRLDRWVSTVLVLISRLAAICLLVLPSARSLTTSPPRAERRLRGASPPRRRSPIPAGFRAARASPRALRRDHPQSGCVRCSRLPPESVAGDSGSPSRVALADEAHSTRKSRRYGLVSGEAAALP